MNKQTVAPIDEDRLLFLELYFNKIGNGGKFPSEDGKIHGLAEFRQYAATPEKYKYNGTLLTTELSDFEYSLVGKNFYDALFSKEFYEKFRYSRHKIENVFFRSVDVIGVFAMPFHEYGHILIKDSVLTTFTGRNGNIVDCLAGDLFLDSSREEYSRTDERRILLKDVIGKYLTFNGRNKIFCQGYVAFRDACNPDWFNTDIYDMPVIDSLVSRYRHIKEMHR